MLCSVEIVKSNTDLILAAETREKEIQAMELLQVSQRPFIMAVMDSRIVNLTPVDAGKEIYKILKVIEMDSGLTRIHDDDIAILAKSTHDIVNSNYKGLTVSEFRTACKNGVIGAYGEWFGFCLKSVVKWIEGYVTLDARKQAIKDWNDKLEREKFSEKPLVEKMFFSKQACIKTFEYYRKYKEEPFGAFSYYDILNELIGVEFKGHKTLVTDPEVRKKIFAECLEKHNRGLTSQKKKKESSGDFKVAEAIMSIVASDHQNSNGLVNLQKAALLKHFFDQLIKEKKELIL